VGLVLPLSAKWVRGEINLTIAPFLRSKEVPLKSSVNKNINEKITIPQELQLAYSDTIMILSDPLSNSSLELELTNQLNETDKIHEGS